MESVIKFTAQYLYIIIVLIAIGGFISSAKEIQKNYLKISLLTLPLSFIVGTIGNLLIQDPRPFIIQHVQPLIQASTDNGFPSDHALLTMTIASIIFIYHKKMSIVLGLFALVVGIARVLANVHHPLDIAGSIVISLASTYLAWHFLNKFVRLEKPAHRRFD
ncbi:MAG: phosphatase PAP2 family protein [Patescibacteria group bacterium]|nr:phosphatase PAP2 family protein [Patescibacteria group bacterium]